MMMIARETPMLISSTVKLGSFLLNILGCQSVLADCILVIGLHLWIRAIRDLMCGREVLCLLLDDLLLYVPV